MVAYNTGGFHEVHILKITDKEKLLSYFNEYKPISNNIYDIRKAVDNFKNFYEPHLFKNIDYDKILLTYTQLLENMGLSLTKGNFSADSTYNSSGFIRWKKIEIKTDNGIPELYTNSCSNL